MPTIFNPKRKNAIFINTGGTVSPTPAPPSFNNTKSLAFDGVDEYIDLSQQNLGTTNTISLWLKNPSIKGAVQETLLGNPLNTFNQFLNVDWNTGKMFYKDSSNNRVEWNTLATINDTNWNNIIITRSGATVTLYFNGVSQGTGTTFGTLGDTEFRYLGINFNTNTQAFDGNIDEVAAFNSVLTTDQINTISTAPSDLTSLSPVAWYRCGDNSTYQTPQILMPEQNNISKVSNYSFVFDGINDYIDIGNPTELQLTGDFTFSAWIKTSASGSTQVFIGKDQSATERSYLFLVTSTGNLQLVIWRGGSAKVVTSTGTLNDGNWHNAIAINDGTNLKLYIDGVADGTLADGGSVDNTTANFNIGRRSYSTVERWFNGSIDEVAIWNSDQTANVSAIYNSGEPTTISGAVAHWRLGEKATFSTNWTVFDQVGSNDGTSANMTIEDRIGNASNSDLNSISYNMEAADIDNDTP